MKLVRCDSCGVTVECPSGIKPKSWFEREWMTQEHVGQRIWVHQHQQHACSEACRKALAANKVVR